MKNFIINDIEDDVFTKLITILDYEFKVSDCIKSIYLPEDKNKLVVLDTLLYSGLNSYRFLKLRIGETGEIVEYSYTNVNRRIHDIANNIVVNRDLTTRNSVLTNSQIETLKKVALHNSI